MAGKTIVTSLVIWVVVQSFCFRAAQADCAFRGTCVSDPVCDCTPGTPGCELGSKHCPFPAAGAPCVMAPHTPPKKAEEVAESIESVCPGVFDKDDDVCCAEDQLSTLNSQLKMARGLLKSCPACWANFARFWCTFTCSPTQASFVDVTQSAVCNSSLWPACSGSASDDQGSRTVQHLRVRVAKAYADGLFNSCKDVTLSATGENAMRMVFGGAKDAAEFLSFQGTSAYSAGQNPLKIAFDLLPDPSPVPSPNSSASSTPPFPERASASAGLRRRSRAGDVSNSSGVLSAAVVPCDTSDPEFACMCTDCARACPAAPRRLLDRPWWTWVMGASGVQVNAFVAMVTAGLVVLYLVAGLALVAEEPPSGAREAWTRGGGAAEERLGEQDEAQGAAAGGGGEAAGTGDGEIEREDGSEGIGGGRTLGAGAGGEHETADRVGGGGEEGAAGRVDEGQGAMSGPGGGGGGRGGGARRSSLSRKGGGVHQSFEWLYVWGRQLGYRPGTMLAVWIGVGVVSALVLCVHPLEVVTDPVKLWAKAGSRALLEKEYYDQHFGSFWRSEMVIAKRPGGRTPGGPHPPSPNETATRFRDEEEDTLTFLLSLMELQRRMEAITVSCEEVQEVDASVECGLFGNGSVHYGLSQLCYQATPGQGCLVSSVLEMWQMNRSKLEATPGCDGSNRTRCEGRLREHIDTCAQSGASKKECWSRAGVPPIPKLIFGSDGPPREASASEAFIIEYLLNSDAWTIPRAIAWERKLISLLQGSWAHLELSFSAEASLEAELARGGAADYPTIAVSYLVMLGYVTCSLGAGGAARPLALRLLLALTGVCTVGLALLVAAALCAVAGVKATLIISEVIPFIVLAIGVDNIFILVWGFDASRPHCDEGRPRPRRVSFEDELEAEQSVCDCCLEVPAVRAGLALERVGPSVISAATAQAAAFMIGSWTGMPAVMSFAVLAAVSVAADAVIQLTLFLPILAATDGMFAPVRATSSRLRGVQSRVLRLLFALPARAEEREASDSVLRGAQEPRETLESKLLGEEQGAESEAAKLDATVNVERSWLESRRSRGAVLTVCTVLLLVALCFSTQVQLGLEQAEALPKGSYLIDYFADLATYVKVGAPFFLVVRGSAAAGSSATAMDFGDPERLKALCSRPGCQRGSLGNAVGNLARYPEYTFVATGVSNWVDDLLTWLDPSAADPSDNCCRVPVSKSGARGGVCPAHWTPELHPGVSPPAACACNDTLTHFSAACPTAPAVPCRVAGGCLAPDLPDAWFERLNKTSGAGRCFGVRIAGLCPKGGEQPYCARECYRKFGRFVAPCMAPGSAFPTRSYLRDYFPDFLRSEAPSDPGQTGGCSTGGEHYGADIANLSLALLALHGRPEPASVRGEVGSITATRFMAYHSTLVTQEQYIAALRYMYAFVDALRGQLQLDVGVHSVFYVFFEQYLTMEGNTLQVTGLGLAVVFAVVWGVLGSLRAALLLLSTALAILVALVGVMGAWGVRLNALSAVNLVASIGIAVEFSVHLVHAFLRARGPTTARAAQAFHGVGTAVFSGIAVTKLLGVSVLALAHSRIFVVYYFRMYFSLVLAGSLYGLLLLPVLLVACMEDGTAHPASSPATPSDAEV